MSYNSVFPSHQLVGIAYPIVRSPNFSSDVLTATGGNETRLQNWALSRDKWEIPFAYLAQGPGAPYSYSTTDYATLMGFFRAQGGDWNSFLYDDPTDDVAQGAACINTSSFATTGDGTTTTFQFARQIGAATDLVYDINSNSVNSSGVSGVCAATVGSGGSGYSYCAITFSGGGGTGASGYAVLSGGAVSSIVLRSAGVNYTSAPAIAFQGDGAGAAATAYIAPRVYLNGSYQSSGYTISAGPNGGLITFGSAPGGGVAVTCDSAYFWRVRFESDSIQLSNDASGFFSCKKIVLYQTRL